MFREHTHESFKYVYVDSIAHHLFLPSSMPTHENTFTDCLLQSKPLQQPIWTRSLYENGVNQIETSFFFLLVENNLLSEPNAISPQETFQLYRQNPHFFFGKSVEARWSDFQDLINVFTAYAAKYSSHGTLHQSPHALYVPFTWHQLFGQRVILLHQYMTCRYISISFSI